MTVASQLPESDLPGYGREAVPRLARKSVGRGPGWRGRRFVGILGNQDGIPTRSGSRGWPTMDARSVGRARGRPRLW